MEEHTKELEIKNESTLTVQGFLNLPKIKGYLDDVLKERSGQFIANLVSLVNLDMKLRQCTPRSVMMVGLKATALNLPLDNNLGFAYAIPYGNEAAFQMGYRGFIQLAMRTGLYRSINVIDVRESECQVWDTLTEKLILVPIPDEKEREKAPIVGYAAMFELINGFRKVIFKKKDVLLAHGKRFSKAYKSGPWQSDTDAMCRKTLMKELLSKWGPMTTEIMESIKADQSVIREGEAGEHVYDYIDNAASEPAVIDYGLDEKTLAELHDLFDILNTNEAERTMKLGACKGNAEAAEKLRLELTEMVKAKGKEQDKEKAKTDTEGGPDAGELFNGKKAAKK
jgi:recombination protein RecT